MEQQIATTFSWLLLAGVCSLVAWCYGRMHASDGSQLRPARSPAKESGFQQVGNALPAPTKRPCSEACADQQANAWGSYNKLFDHASKMIDDLEKKIHALTADKASLAKEQARTKEVSRNSRRQLEEALYALKREHAKCPKGKGMSLADEEKATAVESECDSLRQQLAGLQETVARQAQELQQFQQSWPLREQELQRELDVRVEQARQDGYQSAQRDAEVLFANYLASCQDVSVPLATEAPLQPFVPFVGETVTGFDRLEIEAPVPSEPSTEVEMMEGIEVTTRDVMPPYLPFVSTAFTSVVAGEAVLEQGLHLQTAERTPVAAANIDPFLPTPEEVAAVHRAVEQMPALEFLESIDAMIAAPQPRVASGAQPVGDHARTDGDAARVEQPACERQTPPELGHKATDETGMNSALTQEGPNQEVGDLGEEHAEINRILTQAEKRVERLRGQVQNAQRNLARAEKKGHDVCELREMCESVESTLRSAEHSRDTVRTRLEVYEAKRLAS